MLKTSGKWRGQTDDASKSNQRWGKHAVCVCVPWVSEAVLQGDQKAMREKDVVWGELGVASLCCIFDAEQFLRGFDET